MKSIILIENLFLNNQYQTYKILEDKLVQLREEFKSRMQEEETRKIYATHGLVAKYTRFGSYKVNQVGLNEFLNDLGLLIPTAIFEKRTDLEEFQNEQTYHLRINAKIETITFDFSNLDDQQLAKEWKNTRKEYDKLNKVVEAARKEIMTCEVLQKEKKLKFTDGSISLAKNKQTYDVQAIANKLGINFVIENAKTSSEKVQKYIDKGFIQEKDLNQFRALVDIQVRFSVMTLEDEGSVFDALKGKRVRASLNYNRDAV